MTGAGNWTYLIPGSSPVLIDAGVGRNRHLDALAAQVAEGPALVVVTHAHPDHISGAPALAARWPRCRFAKRPWPERDAPVPWERLEDGDRVPSSDGDLLVVHTPGHAPDHLALWHAESRTVFSGDLLVAGSTVVIPASHGGSLTAYLASLHRVAALGPERALPAHGPAIDDPAALIADYLAHRAQREQQVLDALHAGAHTVEAIAARIYPELTAALLPQAHDSTRAHLQKLLDEGTVRHEAGRWYSSR